MSSDLYADLKISKGASAEEVKPAYRKLAWQLHPDKNAGRAGRDDDALPALCRWCLSPTGQLRAGGSHPRGCTWRSFSRGSTTRTGLLPHRLLQIARSYYQRVRVGRVCSTKLNAFVSTDALHIDRRKYRAAVHRKLVALAIR